MRPATDTRMRGTATVLATAGRALLNGSLLDRQERAVRGGDKDLVIALSGTRPPALRRPGW